MTDPVARPLHERIADPLFRKAVACIDAGDADGLAALLAKHPALTQVATHLPGEGYFEHPTLLEFIAENPIRHGRMPENIVEVAQAILDADPGPSRDSVTSALALVCSGRIVRECGYQLALIALLCRSGAETAPAMRTALGHSELAAAEALLSHGALLDLPVAAGLGYADKVDALIERSNSEQRHLSLALSAQLGHAGIVLTLLERGEDPSRYNPEGAHAHSTPLHQAALAGHDDVVRALLYHGARRDLADKAHNALPWQWARHAGHAALAERLKPHT